MHRRGLGMFGVRWFVVQGLELRGLSVQEVWPGLEFLPDPNRSGLGHVFEPWSKLFAYSFVAL